MWLEGCARRALVWVFYCVLRPSTRVYSYFVGKLVLSTSRSQLSESLQNRTTFVLPKIRTFTCAVCSLGSTRIGA
jgi:hypothetical protein